MHHWYIDLWDIYPSQYLASDIFWINQSAGLKIQVVDWACKILHISLEMIQGMSISQFPWQWRHFFGFLLQYLNIKNCSSCSNKNICVVSKIIASARNEKNNLFAITTILSMKKGLIVWKSFMFIKKCRMLEWLMIENFGVRCCNYYDFIHIKCPIILILTFNTYYHLLLNNVIHV